MLISIIIPAYNAQRFLAATIESVLEQTYQYWQLIVVDDGSLDETVILARNLADRDNRIRVVSRAKAGSGGSGPGGARNLGVQEASLDTVYFAFLDHDDVWEKDALQTLVTALENEPMAVAAYGLARYIDNQGEPIKHGVLEEIGRGRRILNGLNIITSAVELPTVFEMLALECCITTPGQVLIRRIALDTVGLFDASLGPCDDWDMWLRLCQIGTISFVDRVVLGYRIHDANLTSQRRYLKESEWYLYYKWFCREDLTIEQRCILGRSIAVNILQSVESLENGHLLW